MLNHIDHKKMGRANHGWLDSHFHFSFAEYFNPDNIQFGILRVLNDDTIQPGTGFPTHPHKDMEIISYVIQGALSHKDSIGNERSLTRGQVQYMSAGTGIAHSEYNLGKEELRIIQLWILPDKKGYPPAYGDHPFVWQDRSDQWLPIATGHENTENTAPITIRADANVSAAYLSAGKRLPLEVGQHRQAYLVLLEGDANIDGIEMAARDALEIIGQDVTISTQQSAHLYVIDVPQV